MELIIGIDISKSYLDCFDSEIQKHKRYTNNEEGIKELITTYSSFTSKQVIIEAVGCYQNLLHQKLDQANFKVCVVNAYKARCFAKSAGFLAKTDKVDSKMLCIYGQKVDCRKTSYPSKAREELDNLCNYCSKLEIDLHREQMLIEQNYASEFVKEKIKKHVSFLEEEIKQLKKQISKLLQEEEEFSKKKDLLDTVPGIGAQTVISILRYLPELGNLNRKEVAALCGVAPFLRDSGQTRGKAMIKGGRVSLRSALYMPLLTCIRLNPTLKPFYTRLRTQGKPFKVALIACMRKLLIILNLMVKNKTEWKK